MSLLGSMEQTMDAFHREMEAFHDKMNAFHDEIQTEWQRFDEDLKDINAVEVISTNDGVVFRVSLDGFREDEVKVKLRGSTLKISAKHESKHESKRDLHLAGGVRWESQSQKFFYAHSIPEGIDPVSLRVSFKNGLLEVTMSSYQKD
jgi:HSP20 family molecular chaperone IbpA